MANSSAHRQTDRHERGTRQISEHIGGGGGEKEKKNVHKSNKKDGADILQASAIRAGLLLLLDFCDTPLSLFFSLNVIATTPRVYKKPRAHTHTYGREATSWRQFGPPLLPLLFSIKSVCRAHKALVSPLPSRRRSSVTHNNTPPPRLQSVYKEHTNIIYKKNQSL